MFYTYFEILLKLVRKDRRIYTKWNLMLVLQMVYVVLDTTYMFLK